MEERKRRVTRKYLRERMDITYSEMAVPEAEAEGEEVLASEKFQQPQVDLKRQRPGAARPLPAQRPQPQQMENRNWLLAEDPEMADPYADPFAREDPFARDDPFADSFIRRDSEGAPEKEAGWATWGREREGLPFGGAAREGQYNPRGDNFPYGQQSGIYGPTKQETFSPHDPRASSVEGSWRGFQQQEDQSSIPFVGKDPSRGTPSNPSFNQGRFQSPFPQKSAPALDRSFGSGSQQEPRSRGYVPYKSPYQIQRDQQKQGQWGGYIEPRQEYQRPDAFQQWKARSPAPFDPTSDRAFVDEMMPKTRR